MVALEVLNNYQRKKIDESNDEEFYSDPKFVYHLDANFRQNLSDLYEREIDNNSTVLDLMSSFLRIFNLSNEFYFQYAIRISIY